MLTGVLNGEKASAALVVALVGAIAAVVANGPRPLSPKRMVSGVLSNPVPKGTVVGRGASRPRQAPDRRDYDIEILGPPPGR